MSNEKTILVCDKCGARNWNLASEGKSHDQPANPVKGYEACDGVWRVPYGKVNPPPWRNQKAPRPYDQSRKDRKRFNFRGGKK